MDKIETEKRLTVGYGITLEGKISNCDKLIVYGYVNADLTDVKTLHISESGKFSGFAAIENAEISGAFEGDLIVENSIVINATGKMSGKVTYGSIEIKPGGKFTGQIVDASDLAASGGETKAKRSVKKADDSAEAKSQDEFTLSPEPIKEIA
jgi:cytoskeletal protein CcmA (bactofilin family)